MTVFGIPLTKARLAYCHDLVMAAASLVLSLYLRVGDDITSYGGMLSVGVLVFTLVAAAVFRIAGMYRGVWRYASVNDLMAITRAVTLTILLFLPVMFLWNRLDSMPRSLPLINWFVLMTLVGGPRFVYRLFKDRRLEAKASAADKRVPVLLVGCDDDAELFIRATQRNPLAQYRAVAMISDKANRVGRNIHGVSVIGTTDRLPDLLKGLAERGDRPQKLVIADDRLAGDAVRELLDQADRLGLPLSRAPKVTDFKTVGEDTVSVRPIALEDLLGRPQAVLDQDGMRQLIRGKRVLVTGAGGSIGSELVRQIAGFGPDELVLVDNCEYALYRIDLEMAETKPDLRRTALLGDVRDRQSLDTIFAAHRPQLVFHAAALKHVPIVEANPVEGVLTNVVGSRNVADACVAFGVSAMVMISTDKAVNPTNVMGTTKRVAEMYCQSLDLEQLGTRFVTVRFGNVLGSTGSVVPLFQRQLERGGPLTVTHPEIERFFMTIREAVELVLQASTLGVSHHDQGKIYVLDMGKPVKIVDLARQMIRLAGLRPDKDVEIVFTGLRPGEKLYEEVFHGAEETEPTDRDGILLASPRSVDIKELAASLHDLTAASRQRDCGQVRRLLQGLVPEFRQETADTKVREGEHL
ncbi:MAG: polysaccharide biosynthesis protein [Solirubrobacterales bacterium]